ncbi:MAG TPA: DUF4229 domain-containing protein [Cellulomonas sp.]
MPLLTYSLLRLAVLGGCWALLLWAGLNPLLAVVAAALLAWGISYVAMPGPRDAAATWLAERHARRTAGVPALSARARQDAADEDALVAAQDAAEGPWGFGEAGGTGEAADGKVDRVDDRVDRVDRVVHVDDQLEQAEPAQHVEPVDDGRDGGSATGQSASPRPSSTP